MYVDSFPPLTFSDLSAAVSRGFGQAPGSCLEYDANGNCTTYESSYPIVVSPSTAAQMNASGDSFPVGTVAIQAPQSGGLTIGGVTIPTWVILAAAVAGGLSILGGRR